MLSRFVKSSAATVTSDRAGVLDRLAGFDPVQAAALAGVRHSVDGAIEPVLTAFYEAVARDPKLEVILRGSPGPRALAAAQKGHWAHLLRGEVDEELRRRCKRIGAAHVRAGLGPEAYVASYAWLTEAFLGEMLGRDGKTFAQVTALLRAVFIDMSLALSAFLDVNEDDTRQREAQALAETVEKEMRHINRAVQSQADELGRVVKEMAEAIGHVGDGVGLVERSTDASGSAIASVASATEEMLASSREVGRQAENASALVQRAVKRTDDASETIERLLAETVRVSKAVELIDGKIGRAHV